MQYNSKLADTGKTQKNVNRRRKTRPVKWVGIVYFLLFLAFWGGLIFGGFYITKDYLDKSINNIQQTNAMNIQELKDRLDSLTNEMVVLKQALNSTDQNITSSGSIQVQLNKKIEVLDQQLKNLEKSLNILKEAPNARR